MRLLLLALIAALLLIWIFTHFPQNKLPTVVTELTKYTCTQCRKSTTIDLNMPIPVATSYASAMARGCRLKEKAAYEAGICTRCASRNAEAVRELNIVAERRNLTALHVSCAREILAASGGGVESAIEKACSAVTTLDPSVREIAECLAADADSHETAMQFTEIIEVAEALVR